MRIVPLLCTAAVLSVAGCGSSSIPDGISDIRVCTDTSLDARASRCTQDERSSQLVAPKLNCSVGLANRAGKTIVWRFLLDGEEAASYSRVIPKGKGTLAAWIFSQPRQAQWPLPGGSWTCIATIGDERLSATFRSGGPAAHVQALAVCRTSATVPTENGPRMCPRDESAAPIHSNEITCSAAIAGAAGSMLTARVVRDGATVLSEGPLRVPRPMTSVGAPMTLPAGEYACAYALDGRTVASKRFAVG